VRPTVSLLGLDFTNLDAAHAANLIADRPANEPFGYIVTPNADHLVRLSRDPLLRAIYRIAAMCLLDSRVVFWLARTFGLGAPLVATGSDLTEHILRRHLNSGERITIIGLSPDWLPALIERCGLVQPAHYDPPMDFEHDPNGFSAVIDFVRAHPVRFVFLAVGSPRQERLAAALADCGDITGTGFCIGASLEFLAGARRRAPRFMRLMCLEWLFRFAAEPRRLFRRYVIDSPAVIALLLKQRPGFARSLRRSRS
jgi:N-acetylglucosaminyldiphosphoundecaprenol N-acetyl-beta-D-mannosaminyltransferase